MTSPGLGSVKWGFPQFREPLFPDRAAPAREPEKPLHSFTFVGISGDDMETHGIPGGPTHFTEADLLKGAHFADSTPLSVHFTAQPP